MRFKMKALGLAMFAALALSAVAISTAGAENNEEAEFTQPQNNYPVSITGHQEGDTNFFESTDGNRTECEVATYDGTLEDGSAELTVDATYEKCVSNGSVPTVVDMNSCDFLFTAGTYTPKENDSDGAVHVKCEDPGDSITITVGPSLCTIHIPEQTIDSGITFTNKSDANGDYVTVDVEIQDEITYTETDTPSVLFCPFKEHTIHRDNGDFFSDVTVRGYEDPSDHGVEDLVDIDVGSTP